MFESPPGLFVLFAFAAVAFVRENGSCYFNVFVDRLVALLAVQGIDSFIVGEFPMR
jgi:hypothetical protein